LALAAFQKCQVLRRWLFKRELFIGTYLADLKTDEIGLGRFSTALVAAQRNLLSNRREVFLTCQH
jgi:hypothetical protein